METLVEQNSPTVDAIDPVAAAQAILAEAVTRPASAPFVERRGSGESRSGGPERRQFRATTSARPEVAEFAQAVDAYKAQHHRRFITFDELYNVMVSLGYHK